MIRNWVLLLSLIVFKAQVGLGAEEFPAQAPVQRQKPSIFYSVINSVALHIDQKLQKVGVQIEACSFTNSRTQKTTSYNGLGPCLYENFVEGVKSSGPVGVIYAWAHGREKLLPLRVDWRPSEEGWKKMFKELVLLDFEGIYKLENASKELPTPYKQSLIGRVKLSIPAKAKLSDYIPLGALDTLIPSGEDVTSLELQVKPTYRKDGLNYYQGLIKIQNQSELTSDGQSLTIDFNTDLNILRTGRTFKVEGQVSQ